MRSIFVIILVVSFMGSLMSYSILESQSGHYIQMLDARSTAMGSSGITNSHRLFSIFANPANLAGQQSSLGFQAGSILTGNSENRSLPMYNSFDAYSGEGTYVSNNNIYSEIPVSLYAKYEMNHISLAAALSYRPFISFQADYFEEVRNNANSDNNNYPPVLANNYIESKGVINAASLTLAAAYGDFVQAGLEIASLQGEADWKRKINWTEQANMMMLTSPDSLVNSYSHLKREFKGMQIKVGTNFIISPRISAGLSFSPSIDFDVTGYLDTLAVKDAVYMYYTEADSLGTAVKTDSIMYSEFISPARLKLGINFQPQNIMRTYFNLDVEMVNWSDLNDLFKDEFNFYLGVEHTLKYSLPLRIGFAYETFYALYTHNDFVFADKISMPSFSAGTGFRILDRFTVDLAVKFAHRQYEALDLFNDSYYDHANLWANYQYLNLQDRGWENPDTVKERFVNLQTSISFNW